MILIGDFNIDTKCKDIGTDKLEGLCNAFNLKNLVKSETCFTKDHKSLIDLVLTNKPLSFQRTQVAETGLSDYHKLITTFFKCKFQCLKPKIICYRKYKSFIESAFLNDVAKPEFELGSKDPHEGYDTITNNYLKLANKHVPLKKKIIRGNDAPFMNKEFRKGIYTRTKLKNKFLKNLSEQNELLFKKQRNICVSLK